MNAFRMRMPFSWRAVPGLRELKARLSAFARLEGGAAAIFFALSSPVWLGGLALGAEVGVWYYSQQRLQATADAVALGVAARAGTGPSLTELNDLAEDLLTENQFEFSKGAWEMALAEAPRESVFVDGSSVEVRLTRSFTRYLSGIFLPGEFVIEVNATAQVNQATEGCILGLDIPRNGGRGMQLIGADVQVSGCEVLSNGNLFGLTVGSRLVTDCARSATLFFIEGTLDVACRNGQPITEAGYTLDPYFERPDLDPLPDSSCLNTRPVTITSGTSNWQDLIETVVVNGRTYAHLCEGADVTIDAPGGLITVPQWTFIFDRANFILLDRTHLSGVDVSFYFVNGGRPAINAPNSVLTLSADASGMLFRGAKTNSLAAGQTNQLTFGPGSILQGAIYFPASEIQFQASGSLNGCPQIIGSIVTLTGGAWQLNGPCTAPGVLPIVASRVTNLTQ